MSKYRLAFYRFHIIYYRLLCLIDVMIDVAKDTLISVVAGILNLEIVVNHRVRTVVFVLSHGVVMDMPCLHLERM